jgi:putative transposase
MCREALKDAFEHDGQPKICNTDQGSQLASADWVNALASKGINISMHGKGKWVDNALIERRGAP